MKLNILIGANQNSASQTAALSGLHLWRPVLVSGQIREKLALTHICSSFRPFWLTSSRFISSSLRFRFRFIFELIKAQPLPFAWLNRSKMFTTQHKLEFNARVVCFGDDDQLSSPQPARRPTKDLVKGNKMPNLALQNEIEIQIEKQTIK